MVVVSKDRVEGIKAKVSNAREDWKSLMNNLQTREDALKVWTFSKFIRRFFARQPDRLDFKFEIWKVLFVSAGLSISNRSASYDKTCQREEVTTTGCQ